MRELVMAVLALSLSAAACRIEHVAPGEESNQQVAGSVAAEIVGDAVRVTNGTDRPVAYAVWPRWYLGLFSPCADPAPSCVNLAAGASATIPIAAVEGVVPETDAVTVRWWRVEPDEGGVYRAGPVTEIDLEL